MLIAVHTIKTFVQKSIPKTDIANSSKITKCSIFLKKKLGDLNALCLDYTSTQNLNLWLNSIFWISHNNVWGGWNFLIIMYGVVETFQPQTVLCFILFLVTILIKLGTPDFSTNKFSYCWMKNIDTNCTFTKNPLIS